MKKILKYLMATFVLSTGIMFISMLQVHAAQLNVVNGKDTPAGGGGGKCAEGQTYNFFCRYSNYRGTRITVIYYDGSSYRTLGKSLDIYPTEGTFFSSSIRHTNPSSNSKVAYMNVPTKSSLVTMKPAYSDSSAFNTSYFQPASNGGYNYGALSGMPTNGSTEQSYWEKVFLKDTVDANGNIIEDSVGNQIVKNTYGKSLADPSAWTEVSEPALPEGGGINQIGYRILIEPLYIFKGKDNYLYVMTPTEYASLIWNTGANTTHEQVSYYLRESERMYTAFDDIGIPGTTACKSVTCHAIDVQFSSGRKNGHALKIIDITDIVKNDCDYETGEGFPKDKQRGDELTEQEEKCCEQQLQAIKDKYKGAVQTPQQCMIVSDSVPSFINCMGVYFQGNATAQQLWEQEKQELLEFDEKYPACSAVGCEFQPLIQMEETYISCVRSMDIITWINSIILCKDTSCEINYKSELHTYKENHLLCDTEEWEAKIATHKCTALTPGCDEDNPNHFPKPGDPNPDMTCCLYFEEQMKIEYSNQGLSQAEINQKINDWFFEPGKEFRQNCLQSSCNINDTTLTEECCEELMEAYPEYPDEFWIGKGCKPEEKDKCTWHDYADELIEHLKQMMNVDCSIGTSNKLEANDTTNWECIFDSDNIQPGTKEEVFKDYYVKYSNPYCAVYCREDVKYDFPDGSMIVKAGNHFTVGDTGREPEWKSVQFSSTRECKTQGSTRDEESEEINTEQFEEDWEEANDRVISTWDTWKIAQQQDWSYANSKRSPQLDCDYRCVKYCRRCGKNGCSTYCCQRKPFGYTMYPATVYYAPFEQGNQNVTPGTWCSTKGHPDPGSAAKQKTHQKAKEDMETIETDIHACTSWNEFDSYRYATFSGTDVKAIRYAKYSTYTDFVDYKEFNPDLTIDYDEPTHDEYDYNDLLKKDVIPTTSDNNFSVTGKRYTIKYKCPPTVAPGHLTCQKVVIFDYSPQKEAHSTYYKEINYTLQDGVFSTILKPQGTAVNGSVAGGSSSQIYIDLGYSALHVHFMTPTGRYDIGLTYPGFTPGSNTTNFEHNFDKLVEDTYDYDCTYQVHNEIIENDDPKCVGDNCEPCQGDNCKPCGGDNCSPATLRGLNLIYRPISLGEPFPGIDGEGRAPGSNWNDTSLIENYITNNRGVSGSNVYTKAPMYQITLTPALIQQIRKYNESTTYNDFNMDCTSEGKECKSYFIRGNSEDGTYNFSNYFQTCKLEGNRGSTTCCGIGNWNDCDNEDGITRR